MLGKERALELLEQAIHHSRADATEVVIEAEDRQVTRFAGSAIHQNMAETNTRATVRVVLGKKIGYASTNSLADGGLLAAVDQAHHLAELQAADPEFVSLPGPSPIPAVQTFFAATAASSPEQRADAVGQMVAGLRPAGCEASGAFTVDSTELAVGNSLGIRAHQPLTGARVVLVASKGDASGYAEWEGRELAGLDPGALAARAGDICRRGRNPVTLEPGAYPVVLQPEAVADMLGLLAYVGLSAQALEERRSFMDGKLGEQVCDARISLWDDGADPRTLAMPFDYEGVPKEKVVFIDRGVARGVVYDSYTAHKAGRRSTGHALPPPNVWGPYPVNMVLAAGESTVEEMIAGTERGLLVTTFHYTNVLSPKETTFTGMTRHGTFLIEGGKLSRPIRNLRFTDSMLGALSRVEAVGREQHLVGGSLAPALKVSSFAFTS